MFVIPNDPIYHFFIIIQMKSQDNRMNLCILVIQTFINVCIWVSLIFLLKMNENILMKIMEISFDYK